MGIVIGIIVVLAVAAFLAVLTCKSKSSDLFKWIGIFAFVAFCFTWVIPYGYFESGSFYEYGMQRLGLTDIPTILYYGVYFCLTNIIYLFAIGGFYGVISKTKSYQTLVKKMTKVVKKAEIPFAIILMVLLIALTSILRTPYVLVAFLPFLVSILLNAKFDKVTTMGLTYGSVLVGLLAASYGTDGLYWFNNYLSITDITTGMSYRLIIGAFALVLYVGYNIFRILKTKKNRTSDLDADLFAVAEVKDNAKIWPTILVFGFMFIIMILGFVAWDTNFGITAFTDFHKWLTELTIGEDFTIFGYLLGANAVAFGKFELAYMIIIVLFATLLVLLTSGMKLKEFIENYSEGFKKIVKPVCLVILTFVVFIVSYMSPFMAYITDWAYGLFDSFNPYITTITSFITSIFHADMGYTSYIVGSALTTNFASNFNLVHTLYIVTYGLVQLCVPVGGLLLFGLSSMNIDYKSWFKYIWMFFVTMLVVILVFGTLVTYVI